MQRLVGQDGKVVGRDQVVPGELYRVEIYRGGECAPIFEARSVLVNGIFVPSIKARISQEAADFIKVFVERRGCTKADFWHRSALWNLDFCRRLSIQMLNKSDLPYEVEQSYLLDAKGVHEWNDKKSAWAARMHKRVRDNFISHVEEMGDCSFSPRMWWVAEQEINDPFFLKPWAGVA